MADRVSSQSKKGNHAISGQTCVDHCIPLLKHLSKHRPMHFITNGYKRFSKTNSTDPRQRVPLTWQAIRLLFLVSLFGGPNPIQVKFLWMFQFTLSRHWLRTETHWCMGKIHYILFPRCYSSPGFYKKQGTRTRNEEDSRFDDMLNIWLHSVALELEEVRAYSEFVNHHDVNFPVSDVTAFKLSYHNVRLSP